VTTVDANSREVVNLCQKNQQLLERINDLFRSYMDNFWFLKCLLGPSISHLELSLSFSSLCIGVLMGGECPILFDESQREVGCIYIVI
jgi:hypothetical protein